MALQGTIPPFVLELLVAREDGHADSCIFFFKETNYLKNPGRHSHFIKTILGNELFLARMF